MHTFPLVLTTLAAYFDLCLVCRIEVPKGLRDLDIYYNLSSF